MHSSGGLESVRWHGEFIRPGVATGSGGRQPVTSLQPDRNPGRTKDQGRIMFIEDTGEYYYISTG